MSSGRGRIVSRRRRSQRRGDDLHRRVEVAELQALKWPPPPLPSPFRGSTSLRYQFTAVGTATVTIMCLARLVNYTTTTTQAESLLEAIKINRVHFWLPPYVNISGTSSSIIDAPSPKLNISINDSAVGNLGPRKEITMVASEKGAYYSWKPRGAMADWISLIDTYVNSTVWMDLFPTDCFPIVQLDFAYQMNVAASPARSALLTVGTVVDTTSANAIVFFPLDNYLSSGTEGTQLLSPISLSTITVNDPLPKSGLLSTATPGCVVSSSSSAQGRRRM